MIDGTEKPKIPSKFSKHAARYNEFGSKPTYSVEMRGNQAIAGRECKKGEPKASHTDSKRLFVLKAKTLERQGAFVCLKKFACCSPVPRPLSLHYGFLQARRAAS